MNLFSERRLLISITFLIGLVSLFIETVSFNIAYLYVTENSHVAAIVLSAFLGGVHVATVLVNILVRKRERNLLAFLLYIHVATLLYVGLLVARPDILGNILYLIFQYTGVEMLNLAVIWLFLFIPGFLVGAVLPVILAIATRSHDQNIEAISKFYAIDIFGGVVGTLVAGFVFLPMFGVALSLVLPLMLVFVSIIALVVLMRLQSGGQFSFQDRCVVVLTLLAIVFSTLYVYVYAHDRFVTIPYEHRFGDIVFQENSPFGVVTIGDRYHDGNKTRTLFINYRDMCLSSNHEAEKFIAEVAGKNIAADSKVLALGLGCGFTARALLDSGQISHLDLYEINPVVAAASTKYFFTVDTDPAHDERVTLVEADGLHAIRTTEVDQYDAVVIDVEEPGVIQSSPLYSVEYLSEVNTILKDDGILTMWAIKGGETYNQILYKTVASIFKHTYYTIDKAENVQIFASQRPIEVPEGQVYEESTLAAVELNRLFNNTLAKNYSITESFGLPEYFDDPMIEITE